ncbi:MAG TPA: DUF6660 family protein [Puia sp.]|nr:DUF6660 family protein [Puia sp.]
MRFSAFLLSLLVLTQTCVPCRDHTALTAFGPKAQQWQDASHTKGQADCDDCSPFCSCSCCASVSLAVHIPQVGTQVPEPVARHYSFYHSSPYSTDRSAVWQPPRIG